MTENNEAQTVLEQRNKGLTTLLNVSKNLVGTLDVQRVMQETVDGVSQLFGLGTAAIYMLDGDNVRLAATFPPLPPDFPEQFRFALLKDHPRMEDCIRSQRVVHVPNAWEEESTPAEREIHEGRNLYTLVFVPLVADEEVLGAFIVGSVGKPVTISPFEIDLASTLANLAALAVKNASLFEAGKAYAAQLEQSIEEQQRTEAERQKLQMELFQVQKLDAIGQLAGGVAHDFNNQLSGIMGYADLLSLKIKDEKHKRYVESILTLAERSSALTGQLLAFARKGQVPLAAVDVHRVLEEVVGILKHTISRKIIISTELFAEGHCLFGDASQIQNTLLNLALNARDAMPDGGTLKFRTRALRWDKEYMIGEAFHLPAGTYVQIEVSDTGTGIDEATMTRMYEPFFTTKKRGKGTGMGLAAVYGTVKAHGGGVEVESKLGEGTTFRLYLPMHDVKEARAKKTSTGTSSPPGREVLLVDDEKLVVTATAEQLEREGFVVHSYFDSEAALTFFREYHASIALVFTDIMMPKMDGAQLYREMKAIFPEVKIIFTSGHTLNEEMHQILKDDRVAFIPKPYRKEELIRVFSQFFPNV